MLLAIGRVHDVAHGSLRLSLSEYNTDEEIDHILKVVPEVVAVSAEHDAPCGGICRPANGSIFCNCSREKLIRRMKLWHCTVKKLWIIFSIPETLA